MQITVTEDVVETEPVDGWRTYKLREIKDAFPTVEQMHQALIILAKMARGR